MAQTRAGRHNFPERNGGCMKARGSIAGLFLGLCMLSVMPAGAYSTASHGYGQGTRLDTENRPYGALEFNSEYGCYDAYAMSADENIIILTFDQGYENGYTEKILDTLREKNVTAIFFLTGDYAKKETALVQRMIAEGHMLGNHGMTHAEMPALSDAALEEEILSLHRFVQDTYHYEMQYLRPPCGAYSEASLATAQRLGYKTVFWSFAYVDWLTDQQPDPADAKARLTTSAHGGAIYLLHSVSATNAAVLGNVIDALRAKGYQL